jgi:hypothetical protein
MVLSVASVQFDVNRGWSSPFPALDSPSTLVLVFAARHLESHLEVFRELRGAYAQSVILGCSTAGEITGASVRDDTLTVCIARFEHTRLVRCQARIESAMHSRSAGVQLGCELVQAKASGALLLCDGLTVNGSELTSGLNAQLRQDVVVTGGLSADGARFKRTWTLDEHGMPQAGLVTAVGFVGAHLRIGYGSRGGWDVFGPRRLVTKSQGNVLYELDQTPALELYKKYLGERAQGLPAAALLFPLELHTGSRRIVRTVLSVDECAGTMTFAGDIPQGQYAQLMRANFDRLIDGAAHAAASVADCPDVPGVCVAISCVGRKLVLGERTEEEAEAVSHMLPRNVHQVGMYSYGELSPQDLGICDLHNQSMTITLIQELEP